MRIAAILVAAGSGLRFGAERPKQFHAIGRQAGGPLGGRAPSRGDRSAAARRATRQRSARRWPGSTICQSLRAARPGRTAFGPGSRRWRQRRRTWCWCTTRRGRSSRQGPSLPCSRRSRRYDGAIPAVPVADTLKRAADGAIEGDRPARRAVPGADAAGVPLRDPARAASRACRRARGDRRCRAAGAGWPADRRWCRDTRTTSS